MAHRLRREVRTVVRADVLGHAAPHEQLGEARQRVLRVEPPADVDREALARVLVNDRQQPELPPIGRAVEDEVLSPDPPNPRPDSAAGTRKQVPL